MWARITWMNCDSPRRIIGFCLLLSCMVCFASPAGGAEVSRKVLVLYNSGDGQTDRDNLVFQNCQTVLNYLGILCDYSDVAQQALPDDTAMEHYRGVITAFISNAIPNQATVSRWLVRQTELSKKLIILGDMGIRTDDESADDVGRIYRYLGLEYSGQFTQAKPLIRYVFKDPDRVEFERRYPLLPPGYELFRRVATDTTASLVIRRTDIKDSESAVVVTGPNGGFAYANYIVWQDPTTFLRQWYINPFTFFEVALGLQGLPRPDTTTLNGTRIAFSHVDADGFSSISLTDGESLCAEVLHDKVLKRYPFPVTISVIVGEIDPQVEGSRKLQDIARDIYRLPNVEPASHSYSHPFYWDSRYASVYDHQYGIRIEGYRHDSKVEIDDSVKYINKNLLPPGTTCRVFQWTGNCLPLESDIARCDALGISNINGGDTMFDDQYNSYTSVAPIYRRVGSRYQVHAAQANENIITNNWTGPFYAYKGIITTMERTGYPRRICPINVYYHFFIAERKESLTSLQEVYEWVLDQDTARLYTSDYLEIVHDYLSATISQEGPGHFVVSDYGRCATIRFDDPSRPPDLVQCSNVIGYAVEPEGLYVSLVPDADEAVIHLSDGGIPAPLPHVHRASGWITGITRTGGSLGLQYRGFDRGTIILGGMQADSSFSVTGTAVGNNTMQLSSDADGMLAITDITTGELVVSWR